MVKIQYNCIVFLNLKHKVRHIYSKNVKRKYNMINYYDIKDYIYDMIEKIN